MKKITLTLASLVVTAMSMGARADQLRLNDINTDDPGRAREVISLLATRLVRVDVSVSPYSHNGYRSADGRYFNYRLYTTIAANDLRPGKRVQLDDIYTDERDCRWVQSEIRLLQTSTARVSAVCSPYRYKGYRSSSGRLYNHRMHTTLSLR